MKRWVLIFLILSTSVSAATFLHREFVNADIDPEARVVCEKTKRSGMVHLTKEKACCIDEDSDNRCNNLEPLLGKCDSNSCIWPTPTFRPSYVHRLRYVYCSGRVVITGDEYLPLLDKEKCEPRRENTFCCPDDAFFYNNKITASFIAPVRAAKKAKKAIMVIRENKWRMAKKGHFKHDWYLQNAMEHERKRCMTNPGPVRIIDSSASSYFKDTRNIHPGDRVFLFEGDSIYTFVSWCD